MSEEIKKVDSADVDMDGQQKAKNEEKMLERWTYTANGYTFTVMPVFLGEEQEFIDDIMNASPVPAKIIEEGVMPTDRELSRWAITLFSDGVNRPLKEGRKKPLLERIKNFFYQKILRRKNYTYYENIPAGMPIAKWVERKVTYKGKNVLFYELERKYQLNKTEIEKLVIFLYQISGF